MTAGMYWLAAVAWVAVALILGVIVGSVVRLAEPRREETDSQHPERRTERRAS